MMRFAGRTFRAGRFWAIEVPILGIASQGKTKKEAFEMIADAVESLANKPGFRLDIFQGQGQLFEVGAKDDRALSSLLLRRRRQRAGLTLAEAAARLGSGSINAYARYEQGRALPSIKKLSQLFAAVASNGDFVVQESGAGGAGWVADAPPDGHSIKATRLRRTPSSRRGGRRKAS